MTVGEVIKENAKKAGITLRELAEKCHITEVSMVRYANDERILIISQTGIHRYAFEIHLFTQ